MTRGSESENGLFAATVTTGAVAAVAAASFGFYTHEAVARLLLRSGDNNAVNARVEDKLSKMERSMQQQHQKDTSMLQDMSFALNQTSTRLEHLDRALERMRLLAASTSATQQPRRRRQGGAR
jgi:HAMP domain-containing protein